MFPTRQHDCAAREGRSHADIQVSKTRNEATDQPTTAALPREASGGTSTPIAVRLQKDFRLIAESLQDSISGTDCLKLHHPHSQMLAQIQFLLPPANVGCAHQPPTTASTPKSLSRLTLAILSLLSQPVILNMLLPESKFHFCLPPMRHTASPRGGFRPVRCACACSCACDSLFVPHRGGRSQSDPPIPAWVISWICRWAPESSLSPA